MIRSFFLNFHLPYYLNSFIVFFLLSTFDLYKNQFFPLWVIYAILPIADMLIPEDNINPTPEESKTLAKQFKWKIPIYLFLLAEWYVLYFSLNLVTTYHLTTFQLIIHIITIGHAHAIGFLFAHELFHKKNKVDIFLGVSDMLKMLYMHFFLEHIYGHHKYVSTPEDPATAKMNQSLYSFLYQSLTGSLANSYNREKLRLKLMKKPFISLSNRLLCYILLELALTLAVYFYFGKIGLFVFIGEAAFGTFMLETINYIRHYGLMRKEVKPGVYEQVSIKHSWNAPQWLQNCILLKLQRHSDHHANSYKPYQCLESLEDSPTLPGGYIGCVTLAIATPVWFYVMNPLAKEATLDKPVRGENFLKCKRRYNIWILVQACFFTYLLKFGQAKGF